MERKDKLKAGCRPAGKECDIYLVQQLQYNIIEYIEQATGIKPKKHGNKYLFDPCFFCGHKGHMFVYPKTRFFPINAVDAACIA